MLNLFGKLEIPGVPHVDVYEDDEDCTKFWMISQRLRAALNDGKPAVGLCAFARDLSLMAGVDEELPTGETEAGLLSMTLECTVSDEDQAKIADWLKRNVLAPPMPYFMPRMFDDGSLRFWMREPIVQEPTLAYPLWTSGEAQLCLPSALGTTFLKGDDCKVKPSLTSSNVASFTTLLGQEGVRLFREGMKNGLLPAHVAYSLQFAARLPALHIRIWGDTHQTYQQLKEHSTIVESSGGHPVRIYPQVSSLQEFKNTYTGVHVEFDENQFATSGNPDLVKKLQDMALGLAQGALQSMFAQPLINGQLNKEALGTDPMQNFKPPGTPVTGGNQLWLKDFEQHADASFEFTFDGNVTKTFSTYPNSALLGIVSLDELKSSFIEADLNTPIFHILDVPVRVSADFARDPIADIQVVMDYDEVDDITGQRKTQHKTFDYVKGDEVFYFRTVMAKRADGSPKNGYHYSTQLNYKASSAPVVTPVLPSTKQSLMLGYDNLSCVSVRCVAGDIPWTMVESAVVDFRLPGIDLPSASGQVVLTPTSSSGSWFSYTGKASTPPAAGNGATDPAEHSAGHHYEYDTTFHLKDGQRLTKKGLTSSAGTLLVAAPFVDRLDAVFVPAASVRPVQQIVLSVRYTDADAGYSVNDTHVFTGAPQPWAWSVEILDKKKRSYEYKADITYTDGSTTPGQWTPRSEEGTVMLGEPARQFLDVTVTPAVLDMSKWKLIIVKLRYAHEPVQETTLQFKTNQVDDQHWKVTLKDPAAKSWWYGVTAFGIDNTKRELAMTEVQDPYLALEL